MRYRYGLNAHGRPEKKAVIWTKDEHHINADDVDRDAAYITHRLQAAGYETYIVGGAVRDLLLGKKPKDFDIATAASPQQIKRVIRNARIIGRRFRLVHVFYGEKIIEVATFRSCKDGSTGNEFGTIDEDVRRRDFTVNALFYDPGEELIVDYVGGYKDVLAKRLRPIIPLRTIFVDDPVRMLRAVKYAASCGFAIPFFLKQQIKANAALLASISASRLTEEISKIIKSSSSATIIEALDHFGLFHFLQPEASHLMKNNDYKAKLLARFADLGKKIAASQSEPLLQEGLLALYRDFAEPAVDWNNAPEETFNAVYAQVRKFVLPMNPPRVQLEQSLRALYREHGVSIVKLYYFDRPRRAPAPGESAEAIPTKDAAKKRRRGGRRHRGGRRENAT